MGVLKDLKLFILDEIEILNIIEPIMENCLQGSNEGNHKKHIRVFFRQNETNCHSRRT